MRQIAVLATAVIGSVAACGARHTPHGPAHTCTFFETETHTSPPDKIDLIFVVDSSPSMSDKAALLATALSDYVNRLVNPECIDPLGNVVGVSNAGHCAAGGLRHPRARDLHVAILSSSLGAAGGDLCASDGIGARQNDRGELLNRVGTDEHSVGDAEPSHFLVWFPSVAQALSQVSDRKHEHDGAGAYVDGDASANCVNPIFAHDLPTDPGGDLCHLARGPRTPTSSNSTSSGECLTSFCKARQASTRNAPSALRKRIARKSTSSRKATGRRSSAPSGTRTWLNLWSCALGCRLRMRATTPIR